MSSADPRIMLVDDSKLARAALEGLLRGEGLSQITVAGSSREARELLGMSPSDRPVSLRPDLILLDIIMEGMDGIELCRLIKQDQGLRDIPVIMLTSRDDADTLRRAFQAGAMDYVTKPYREMELAARVRSALTLKGEVDRRKARELELLQMAKQLSALNAKLKQISNLDGLTGLANRRYFDDSYAREWLRAARHGRPLAVLMMDIDFFKAYNDHFGHAQGDCCLRQVAQALTRGLRRAGDLLARYGGEEFVVVLPETDAEGGRVVAEAMRRHVEELDMPHPASPTHGRVTVSVGVASWVPARGQDRGLIPKAADQALYQAKSLSRNRVCLDCQPAGAA